MSTITWLHLSDFHFNVSRPFDRNIVLSTLLDDIAERINKDDLQPDFIIISGDIAHASRPEEYDLAKEFLDKLIDITNLSKDRLFLVPGNHDVDRSAVELPADAPKIPRNRDDVAHLLDNAGNQALVFQRFHNYRSFINEYLEGHLPYSNDDCFYVKFVEKEDLKVAILGLNSAWLSPASPDLGGDRHQLVLSERQVHPALDQAKGASLILAVMHHPFEWLQDFDRNNVEHVLCRDCNFVIHGHRHFLDTMQLANPGSRAKVIVGGACYLTRTHPNSYNFVRFDPHSGWGAMYPRCYTEKRGSAWIQDAPDGVWYFSDPGVVRTNSVYLFNTLAEWKLIHNESQILLNALNIPINDLRAYRLNRDTKNLRRADNEWQTSCVRKLESVPDRWKLQYVRHIKELDKLREQTSRLDQITRRLVQTDIPRAEVSRVSYHLEGLKNNLWTILTIADKEIVELVEKLRAVIGE